MPFGNPTKENDALIAWDGTTAYPRDRVSGGSFGYVVEVMTTLTADVTIGFEAYDALASNNCVYDPATGIAETDYPQCYMFGSGQPIPVSAPAAVIIPNGTVAGTKIGINLRCYAKQFSGLIMTGSQASALRVCAIILNLHSPR